MVQISCSALDHHWCRVLYRDSDFVQQSICQSCGVSQYRLAYGLYQVYLSQSHRPLLVIALISLCYLTIHTPITLALVARPTEHHFLRISFEVYAIWWLIIALPTAVLVKHIGIDFARLIFGCVFLSLVAGLFERWYVSRESAIQLEDHEQAQRNRGDGIRTPPETEEGRLEEQHDVWKHMLTGVLELPLLLLAGVQLALAISLSRDPVEGSVFVGTLITGYIDESSLKVVFVRTTVAVILLVFPIAPYTHVFHRRVSSFLVLVFLLSAILTLRAFPFTPQTPMRLTFIHTIDLTNGTTRVALVGPSGYFEQHILDRDWLALPLERAPACGEDAEDQFHPINRGEAMCAWRGPHTRIWPYPPSHWAEVETRVMGDAKGVLLVRGPSYTHFTRLLLDDGVKLEPPIADVQFTNMHYATAPNRTARWERLFVLTWPADQRADQRGGEILVHWDEVPEPTDVPDFNALVAAVPSWVQITGEGSRQPLVDGARRFTF